MHITDLLKLSEAALRKGSDYLFRRSLFDDLALVKGKHFIGIVGPRGAGKTIMLQQLASMMDNSFYLSLDLLDRNADLFNLIERLAQEYRFKNFFLDEIHFHANPTGFLKKAYDFLDVRIFFTSSVALQMRATAHDLSRRVRLYELSYLSFREYLKLKFEQNLPKLTLDDLLTGKVADEHLRSHSKWSEYANCGLLPFALEEPNPLPLLENTIQTVIRQDMPSLHPLLVEEIAILEKLLKFIGKSDVDGINYSSLSNNLGITKYKAEQYLTLFENAFLLQRLFPAGTNVLKEPKVLLIPPIRLLYRGLDDALGPLREDLTAFLLRLAVDQLHYLKATRGAKTPDFLIRHKGEKIVFEVGGAKKGRTQFKGIVADRKIVLSDGARISENRLPLHCLGFLKGIDTVVHRDGDTL